MEKTSRVKIIGAGVSGISAAIKLLENGFENVTILEANERIGGRINSVTFGTGGSFIDLGAQWISGENEVYKLMKDHFEFGDTELEGTQTFLLSNDEEVDLEKLGRLRLLQSSIMFENEDLKEEMKASTESFGEFARKKYFQALQKPEYEDIDRELANMVLLLMEKEFNGLNASTSWNEIPAKHFATNIFIEGSQTMTWKKSGYKTLLNFLIKQLKEKKNINLEEEKILFNKKVVNVNWTTENIWIKCEDESEYRCDHVISTIPHGVMRANHQTLFTPQLSVEKVKAIENLGFGTFGKVFLEFKKPILREGEHEIVFLWSEADLNDVRGTDKEWLVQIHGFLHVDAQPNIVEAILAGKLMKEFESYDDAKIINDCMWLLEKFLKKHLDRPINFTRNRWLSNENFLGAYAYPTFKTESSTRENLRKSIIDDHDKPAIIFGGEATSIDHQGYVHGAMEEGWRAAQELIDFYH